MQSNDQLLDLEDLELDYEEKCNDVVELQQTLKATKLEAQQCRMRLRGLEKAASTATTLPSAQSESQRAANLQRLFGWLAAQVDLDAPAVTCQVGSDMVVGDRTLHLGTLSQWRLPEAPGGRMSVNVPPVHVEEVMDVLRRIRAAGNEVGDELSCQLAASWDFVLGNVGQELEPVVFLPHRSSGASICVASWLTFVAPSLPAPVVSDQAWPCVGQRVEVIFNGQWYVGDVIAVEDDGAVNIHCDVDPEDVFVHADVRALRHSQRLPSRGASKDDFALHQPDSHELASEVSTPLLSHRRTRST